MIDGVHPNGRHYQVNERSQKVDEDGFITSAITFITNKRTCVSIKIEGTLIQIRSTEDSGLTALSFNPDEWRAFIQGVKDGEFDI